MKEILEMIEKVDPSDKDALDMIDARVEQYYHELQSIFMLGDERGNFWFSTSPIHKPVRINVPKYTRSRDALKAIRPELKAIGWTIKINSLYGAMSFLKNKGWPQAYVCTLIKTKEENGRLVPVFQSDDDKAFLTEELAELHAILQAIEYDRNN